MGEELNHGLERELTREDVGLLAREEFKGHCSNLQAWVEYDYDTRLLHRNLAFPLLKRLVSVGDGKAKHRFFLEVEKRFKSGYPTVQTYLIIEGYLGELKRTVLDELIDYAEDKSVLKLLSEFFSSQNDVSNHEKVLKKIIWINPIHRKAHLVLAFTFLRGNKLLEAESILKDLLTMYPKDEEATLFLAKVYWFEKKVDKANDLVNKLNLANFSFPTREEFLKRQYGFSSLRQPYKRRLYRPHLFFTLP